MPEAVVCVCRIRASAGEPVPQRAVHLLGRRENLLQHGDRRRPPQRCSLRRDRLLSAGLRRQHHLRSVQ